MTIEIHVQPSIKPTHTMTATEWNRAFYSLVPNGRCTLAGRHEEDMLCVFETGAQLIVKWHAHTPADVVRFALERDMLNPLTRGLTEAMLRATDEEHKAFHARLRMCDRVWNLPPDVLTEAEQALSGLTISDQDKPTCKKWQSTDTATHDFRLVSSWADAYKLSVAPARRTEDGDGQE